MKRLVFILALIAWPAWAAQIGDRYNDYRQPLSVVDTTNAEVKPGDAVNNAIRVNCITGCAGGPGGGLSDAELRATPVPISGTVTVTDGAGALNVIVDSGTITTITNSVAVTGPVTDTQLRATPVPISGTVTVTDGSGALNVIVDSGTTAATQSGTWTVQPGNTPNTTAWKVDGSAVTQPVSGPLTDTQLRATPVPISGALTANQSVNVNQIGGSAVGTAAAGVQKVGIVGNANAAIDAANNAAAPANVLSVGYETATQTTTQPTAATAGNVRRPVASTDGSLYVRPGGPVQWQCNLGAVGTTLTECKAAPGAGLRLYITDILAVSATATSGLFTLRFGTGTNCGTGTGNVFFASAAATLPNGANNATSTKPWSFITPIAITAANALCVLGVVTNTTNIQISGYTAP